MRKSIKKNYIYNLVYQIAAIVLPLVTVPYLSRVLEAENIGIYSYTVSITTYFVLLASLGTSLYGQREIAYVQDDKKKRTMVLWEIVAVRLITTTMSSLIFLLTFILFGDYRLYFVILLLDLISTVFDITWFFQGLEDFKVVATRNLLIKALSATSVFIFVHNNNDLWIYILIYSLSIFISNVSLWPYLRKYITKVKGSELRIKRHIKPIFALFIPQITTQVYTVLDKVMIGAIIPEKTELGFYEQAEKIIKLLITIITALSAVMIPRMTSAIRLRDRETIKRYVSKSFRFVFMLAFPMIFGIIITAGMFVPIFFGPGYDGVITVMQVLSPVIMVISCGSVIGVQFLVPSRRQRELTISYVFGAAINVLMNVALIGRLGAVGAAIGTIVAEATVTLVQAYFIRKDFKIKKIFNIMKNYFISGVIMCIVCLAVKMLVGDGLMSMVIVVCSGCASYAGTLVVLGDSFIKELFHGKVKRK